MTDTFREPAALPSWRDCLSPASFWFPDRLGPQAAWLEHAPFAFWLIDALRPRMLVELGTHGGFSYFVFCQAVQRLQVDTRCYAVDTWGGDEHAGFSFVDRAGQRVLFDCITAWEVLEHIAEGRLAGFLANITANLTPDGIFVSSIALSRRRSSHRGHLSRDAARAGLVARALPGGRTGAGP